jgi:hypothetical protein
MFDLTLTKPNETSKRSLKFRSLSLVNVNAFKVFAKKKKNVFLMIDWNTLTSNRCTVILRDGIITPYVFK